MAPKSKFTRTTETEERYRKKTQALWLSFLVDEGYDHGADMKTLLADTEVAQEFMSWLKGKAAEVSRATWRLYSTGLVFTLNEIGYNQWDETIKGMQPRSDEESQLEKRTSMCKSKSFSQEHLDVIVKELSSARYSKYATPLLCWLYSGLYFGLRPNEWKDASIRIVDHKEVGFEDKEDMVSVILTVKNAKQGNGRSHGKTRELYAQLTEEQYAYVYMHLNNVLETKNFSAFYHECRNLLYHVNQKVFHASKSNISLYSMRHQFNANIKSLYKESNVPRREAIERLAAMNGHASIATATLHYGRARGGWGRHVCQVSVSKESLNAVKELNKNVPLKSFTDLEKPKNEKKKTHRPS